MPSLMARQWLSATNLQPAHRRYAHEENIQRSFDADVATALEAAAAAGEQCRQLTIDQAVAAFTTTLPNYIGRYYGGLQRPNAL